MGELVISFLIMTAATMVIGPFIRGYQMPQAFETSQQAKRRALYPAKTRDT